MICDCEQIAAHFRASRLASASTCKVRPIKCCGELFEYVVFCWFQKQESAPDEAERLSILNALRADAGRLLAEYESNNPAGNRLQRHLLNCEHAFQQLDDRCVAI